MYENTGRSHPKGSLNSKFATGCTKIELAIWCRQDLRSQHARSSWDPPSDSESSGETWNNAVDYRILVIPLSAVEQQDRTRDNKVKKLIGKFENHQHKESFLPSRHEADAEDQQVQQRVTKYYSST